MPNRIRSLLVSFLYSFVFSFLFNIYIIYDANKNFNLKFLYQVSENTVTFYFYSLLFCALFPPMIILLVIYGIIFLVVLLSEVDTIKTYKTVILSILMIIWYLLNYYIINFLAINY